MIIIHKNGKYNVYYGISGRDSRLFDGAPIGGDSRLSSSSKKRFFSNSDYYITFYFCSNLTEVECLYIESNMSLYNHQIEIERVCSNKIQSTLIFDDIDVSLVQICIFMISEKLYNGKDVYTVRMNPNGDRKLVLLDKFIGDIHDEQLNIKVSDLLPKINMNEMIDNLSKFSPKEIGNQFEILDNAFDRNAINKQKIVISKQQFIEIINHFNVTDSYIKRCKNPFEAISNTRYAGQLEKIQARNSKTPLLIGISSFFKGESMEILNQYKELSYGCLLYLCFTKASLFGTSKQLSKIDGTFISNLVYGRNRDNDVFKTAHCPQEKCNLSVQVSCLNNFFIKCEKDDSKIDLCYLVQRKNTKMTPAEFSCQKLHCDEKCLALNIDGFDVREYIRIHQADSLDDWIEQFNQFQLKIPSKSSSQAPAQKKPFEAFEKVFENWLTNAESE